jgi:predicted RNA-binding Zn-ribbon protein involved in translation (DUF1610 family)
MPFIKHEEFTKEEVCMSPEHNAPMDINLKPGRHTYMCPACGREVVINVPLVTC